ncbi:hypothetical protein D623_10010793 [Myotis brandtii]|uniref:Uncharacterized protein n=1 Tax=Myotis brandtii TaxID=109478 RepID=S7N8Y0_MYOBR|nr:hypothetical protein D623_10010793 [Myotis brandtii]
MEAKKQEKTFCLRTCVLREGSGSFSWEQELREKWAFSFSFQTTLTTNNTHQLHPGKRMWGEALTRCSRPGGVALAAPTAMTRVSRPPPPPPGCRQRLDHHKDEEERAALAVRGSGSRNHTFMAGEGRDSCLKMLTVRRSKGAHHTQHTQGRGGTAPSQDGSGQTRERAHRHRRGR